MWVALFLPRKAVAQAVRLQQPCAAEDKDEDTTANMLGRSHPKPLFPQVWIKKTMINVSEMSDRFSYVHWVLAMNYLCSTRFFVPTYLSYLHISFTDSEIVPPHCLDFQPDQMLLLTIFNVSSGESYGVCNKLLNILGLYFKSQKCFNSAFHLFSSDMHIYSCLAMFLT